MPLRLNGVDIEDLRVNGVQVEQAYLNGTEVFKRIGIGDVLDDGGIVYAQDGGDWLVCAPATMRVYDKKWGLFGNFPVGFSNDNPDPNTGEDNTDRLIQHGSSTPAAEYTRSYSTGGIYSLPNIQELIALYQSRSIIDSADSSGGEYTLSYISSANIPTYSVYSHVFSSTMYSDTDTRVVRFFDGLVTDWGKNEYAWVIPVRRI